MGNKDFGFKYPWIEEYVKSGKVKEFVPDLDIIFLPEGTHFAQEQFPQEVNQLILAFLHKHIWPSEVSSMEVGSVNEEDGPGFTWPSFYVNPWEWCMI